MMGGCESLVETPKLENKMGDLNTYVHCLKDSVSFGRFEHDSLCWERWSTFPTNKYLEEVEKCSTAGSVAQKKAYFEAHYKKITARETELLEPENTRESVSVMVNVVDDFSDDVSDKHIDISNNSADVVTEENGVENHTSEVIENIDELRDGVDAIEEVNEVEDRIGEDTDGLNGDAYMTEKLKDIQSENIDMMSHGTNKMQENRDFEPRLENGNEEDLRMKTELPEVSAGVWEDKEVLPQENIEEREIVHGEAEKLVELVDPMKMKKPNLVKKPTYAANAKKKPPSPITKKPAPLAPKSKVISSPKTVKPDVTKTSKSTICPGVKKETGYTPVTSKKGARPETKRALPTSSHMSLSYGPPDSETPSLMTMRKSLIMETMGDKDIVKRAFKAFQNPSVSPSSVGKPTAKIQSTIKRIESKGTKPDTIQKKKEGVIRATKSTSPNTGQQGTRKTSQSPGLKKNIRVDQRNDTVVTASFGSKSLDHGRQHNQADEAPKIRKPKQKINSKAKLSSSYNQGHGFLRGSICKADAKI